MLLLKYYVSCVSLSLFSPSIDNNMNIFILCAHKSSININDSGKAWSGRQDKEAIRSSSIITSIHGRKMS